MYRLIKIVEYIKCRLIKIVKYIKCHLIKNAHFYKVSLNKTLLFVKRGCKWSFSGSDLWPIVQQFQFRIFPLFAMQVCCRD